MGLVDRKIGTASAKPATVARGSVGSVRRATLYRPATDCPGIVVVARGEVVSDLPTGRNGDVIVSDLYEGEISVEVKEE